MENIVIIGSGIAGLTAAVYASRANLTPVVVSGKAEGGQLMLTTDVENFPGFPQGVLGPDLVAKAHEQAKKFGTTFKDGDVQKIEKNDTSFTITTDEETIEAKAVIVATGASARTLGLPSEKTYWQKGVHTCATCDGYFYNGKTVVVVGGGDSAMEESLFLANQASKVIIVHRRDSFRASKIMQDRVLKHEKIEVVWNKEVLEVLGDETKTTGVKIKDTQSGEESEIATDAMFLSIGHIPNTKFVKDLVDLDETGYIIAKPNMHTNVKGLFAAGDCQDKIYRQAVTAAGSGCIAALEAERFIGEA